MEYQGVQGYAYNQYISLGSTHILTHADAVPASCTASGSIEHWYCSVCGERYWDTSGNTFVADVSVPPLGHEYVSPVYTWSEDPSQVGEEVCTCARCGEQETRQIACEILSVSRSGETVTAGISSGFTAVALCAVYDGNGQMLAVRSSDPFRGREEISFSFPDDSFAAAEVFLLGNRSRPLCMSRGL